MRCLFLLCLTVVLLLPGASSATAPAPPLSVILDIDLLLEQALSRRLIAGGVVLMCGAPDRPDRLPEYR